MPLISDIIDTVEAYAPLSLQESYDNCGLQAGDPTLGCTGVLLCVDMSPDIVAEAVSRGCNLVISHHPIIFRGLKHLTGSTLNERTVMAAIKADVALYSCHTAIDSAPGGVSAELARRLGLTDITVLDQRPDCPGAGLGAVGDLPSPLTPAALVALVKETCGSPVARCTAAPADKAIRRVALCGGSGSSLIDKAIAAGADAYVTSDTTYHTFVERADDIFIVDIGHFESEQCTKSLFYRIITEKFPNFAVNYSETEKNPIVYL